MSPVIPFRRQSRYPRVPFALGVLAAIALGAAAIAARQRRAPRTMRPLRFDPTGKCPNPIGAESQRCRRAIAGIPSRSALNDRVVRRRYQFIDQSRRRFAIPKVRLYGGDGNFCEHEGGAPELRRTCVYRKPYPY